MGGPPCVAGTPRTRCMGHAWRHACVGGHAWTRRLGRTSIAGPAAGQVLPETPQASHGACMHAMQLGVVLRDGGRVVNVPPFGTPRCRALCRWSLPHARHQSMHGYMHAGGHGEGRQANHAGCAAGQVVDVPACTARSMHACGTGGGGRTILQVVWRGRCRRSMCPHTRHSACMQAGLADRTASRRPRSAAHVARHTKRVHP